MADNPLSSLAYSPAMCCHLALTILIKGQAENSFPYKAALANLCGGKDITRHSSSGHGNETLVATNVTRTQTRKTHCACVCVCGRCCISAIKTGYELELSIKTKADKSAKLQSAKCSRRRLCHLCSPPCATCCNNDEHWGLQAKRTSNFNWICRERDSLIQAEAGQKAPSGISFVIDYVFSVQLCKNFCHAQLCHTWWCRSTHNCECLTE